MATRAPATDGRRSAAAARRREREREIIAATRTLFDEGGVGEAQIDAIAEAVGINRAIVYRHFSGKEELFALTLVSYLDELRDALDDADDTGAAPQNRLAALVTAFVDYGLAHPAFIDCAQALMRRSGPELLDEISESALFRLGRGISRCLAILTAALQSRRRRRRVPRRGSDPARQHALRQRPRRAPARPGRHPGHRVRPRHPDGRRDLPRPGPRLPRRLSAGPRHSLTRGGACGAAAAPPYVARKVMCITRPAGGSGNDAARPAGSLRPAVGARHSRHARQSRRAGAAPRRDRPRARAAGRADSDRGVHRSSGATRRTTASPPATSSAARSAR